MTDETELKAPAPMGQVQRPVRPVSDAPTLVERLRTRPTGDPYLHMMAHEAADEIERLTRLHLAAIAFMRGVHTDMPAKFDDVRQEWNRQHPDRPLGA